MIDASPDASLCATETGSCPESALQIVIDAFGTSFSLVAETDGEHHPSQRGVLLKLLNHVGCPLSSLFRSQEPSLIPTHDGRTVVAIPVPVFQGTRRYAVGVLNEGNIPLLKRLARTAALAIRQHCELEEQRTQLNDYACQVSRDFEELVWMRSLAEQIECTDIRDPLGVLAESLFPTLLDMIQAQQIVLIQSVETDDSGTASRPDASPQGDEAARGLITRIGHSYVADSTIWKVIEGCASVARTQPLVVNQAEESPAVGPTDGLREFILVPIDRQGERFGWLMAINRRDPDSKEHHSLEFALYNSAEKEFGTFEAGLMDSAASFLASHVKNVQLFHDQEQLLMGVVRAMINAIDAKDPYTCGHSDRVALMSRLLARELALSEVECERIYLTGLLHDVGKIGVPDSVLQKPGRLTDDEFEQIKQHPVIGYNVLKHLRKIGYVLPGVLHHHEAIDGSGYPHGLKGDEIPLFARILAVADSFDAMTSNRPYRRGIPFEKAEAIFRENSGIQWDRDVVSAYFRVRTSLHEVCQNDQDRMRPLLDPDHSASILAAVTATSGPVN
jgi:HD-GYP domain-containing protein (c-di-GMP phosphodiesterase class II)